MSNWTDNRIDWNDYNSSTADGSNWVWNENPGWSSPSEPVSVYRNGKRLKKGNQRPDPFYLRGGATRARQYQPTGGTGDTGSSPVPATIKRKICGAYSRKHDKPRKFRKRDYFS